MVWWAVNKDKRDKIGKMKRIADYVKGKLAKKGAKDIVITIEERNSVQVKFSNSKISVTQVWQEARMNVFAAINQKIISTSLKEFSEKAADENIALIFRFADAIQPNKEHVGIAKGPFNYRAGKDLYDGKIADLREKMADYVEKGINAAEKHGAERTAGVLQATDENIYLTTSNGVEAEDSGTSLYYSIRAFADKEATGHMVSNARAMAQLKVEGAASIAAITAKHALNPGALEVGKYDVLFEPLPIANLLEGLGNAASIFNVESGLSCLQDKLGKKVAGEIVSFYDDATLPYGINSRKFDAEGVPTQRNAIVDNGILKTYLHNTSTAARHNTKTTANAGLIAPSPFNLVLEKGNFNKEEMISEIKKGILVTNVWYTRFQNYATGDFSTIPRDGIFLIEKGKIKKPVKGIRISDNLLNIMQNIRAIGKIPMAVKGWENEIPVTAPAVLAGNANITKSVE